MELIAVSRGGELAAFAYGAHLHGPVLRCPVLFVQRGAPAALTLFCPATQQKIAVKLPPEMQKITGHTRFAFAELEITNAENLDHARQ